MAKQSFLTRDAVKDIYDRNARFYDLAVWGYYLVGMPVGKWRRMGVDALKLHAGDTVVEVGCGTGLNFELLQNAIGPNGKIIGVDISDEMLDRASTLVREKGWKNVVLIRCSASEFEFPEGIGGVIAMGVLTYEPEFERVVERGAKALSSGGRWVVLDYKMPSGWQRILAPLFVALGSSFGVSRALMERHVWKAIERHLKNIEMRELYGGFVYIVSGEVP